MRLLIYKENSTNCYFSIYLLGWETLVTNPNAINTVRHYVRFGDVLEYRIPGGQCARFSGGGKTFIGFLE